MNWKNGLIAVFSPTTGDDHSGVYGTAFPVAKDLILTARHVILPDNADTARPIKLRWWYGEVGWESYDDREKLVLWNCERFDVALLRVERPTAIADRCWLRSRKPTKDGRWESEGFPTAARIEDMVRPSSVAGTTMTKADQENYFQVALDSGLKTSNPEGWGGASGMPIVVGGYVLGVAIRVESNFEAVIQAAPVWKFWDSIRNHVAPHGSTAEFETETKRRLDDFISNAPNALSIICRRGNSGHDFKDIVIDEKGKANSSQAVKNIMKMSPHDLFLTFHFASEALRRKSTIIAPVADDDHHCVYLSGRRLLGRVIDQIAPFVLAVSAGRVSFETGGGIREVPIATPTMAEIVMAAEGRRDINFWPRQGDYDLPRGKAQFPLVVEFSESGDIMTTMIKDAFLREFVGDREVETENVSLQTAVASLMGAVFKQSTNDLDLVNIIIKGKMDRREALPFLAIETPVEETQRQALIQQLKLIHGDIPLLPIMLLAKEKEVLLEEFDEIQHFLTLIPMTQER